MWASVLKTVSNMLQLEFLRKHANSIISQTGCMLLFVIFCYIKNVQSKCPIYYTF